MRLFLTTVMLTFVSNSVFAADLPWDKFECISKLNFVSGNKVVGTDTRTVITGFVDNMNMGMVEFKHVFNGYIVYAAIQTGVGGYIDDPTNSSSDAWYFLLTGPVSDKDTQDIDSGHFEVINDRLPQKFAIPLNYTVVDGEKDLVAVPRVECTRL